MERKNKSQGQRSCEGDEEYWRYFFSDEEIYFLVDSRVLHPQSMRPARESDVPVRVKNSYNPRAPGTLITKSRDMSKAVLTSIVLKRNVTMLDMVSTRMLGAYGFLSKVFSIFEDLEISVDVVATSEVSISLTLDPSKLWSRELIQQELDHVVEELERIARVNLLQNRAIISLIGNVQVSSLILEKVFCVLHTNGVNVQMISQGASKVNISLVVNDSEAELCVRALHLAFFEVEGLSEHAIVSELDDVRTASLMSRKRMPLQVPNGNCEYYLGDRCWRQLTGTAGILLDPQLSMLPHLSPKDLQAMRQTGFIDCEQFVIGEECETYTSYWVDQTGEVGHLLTDSQRMGNIDLFEPSTLK
ncbi:hypothetical protein GIB67_018895, partial [Kingdonia uniflora]